MKNNNLNYKVLRATSFSAIPDDEAYCIHYPNGAKEYFYKKRLHRVDGPAVLFSKDGSFEKVYYYHGKYLGSSLAKYTEEQFKQDLEKYQK